MNLHRTTGQPDWDQVKTANRNAWQRIAAVSRGIVTPGNLISVVGFGLVVGGLVALLHRDYLAGLIEVSIGRAFDLLDGLVADSTGTKSPLGEVMDATIDKAGTVATIVVLGVSQIVIWWVLAILLLPQLAIGMVILVKRQHGTKVHPSPTGKYSMALLWVGILGLILLRVLNIMSPGYNEQFAYDASLVVYAIVVLATIMGTWALVGYIRNQD